MKIECCCKETEDDVREWVKRFSSIVDTPAGPWRYFCTCGAKIEITVRDK